MKKTCVVFAVWSTVVFAQAALPNYSIKTLDFLDSLQPLALGSSGEIISTETIRPNSVFVHDSSGNILNKILTPQDAIGLSLPRRGLNSIGETAVKVVYSFLDSEGRLAGDNGILNLANGNILVFPKSGTDFSGEAIIGLNSQHQILASGNDETAAWRYTPSLGWQNLGHLGGGQTQAFAINNSGAVVGLSVDSQTKIVPFIYTDAQGMKAILGPNGETLFGQAMAINNNGEVAGIAGGQAFYFNSLTGEFAYINAGGGGVVTDINGAGYVIGTFQGFSTLLGWVATKEGFNLLENLIGQNFSDPDWRIGDALDINDQGQILANAFNVKEQKSYQVLLTPVPEPSTYALLALGLAAIAYHRRRK